MPRLRILHLYKYNSSLLSNSRSSVKRKPTKNSSDLEISIANAFIEWISASVFIGSTPHQQIRLVFALSSHALKVLQ